MIIKIVYDYLIEQKISPLAWSKSQSLWTQHKIKSQPNILSLKYPNHYCSIQLDENNIIYIVLDLVSFNHHYRYFNISDPEVLQKLYGYIVQMECSLMMMSIMNYLLDQERKPKSHTYHDLLIEISYELLTGPVHYEIITIDDTVLCFKEKLAFAPKRTFEIKISDPEMLDKLYNYMIKNDQ